MNNPENTERAIKNEQSREYLRGNQKWTIQRNWQHMVHKKKRKRKKNNVNNT
jgi:hypothetical protein